MPRRRIKLPPVEPGKYCCDQRQSGQVITQFGNIDHQIVSPRITQILKKMVQALINGSGQLLARRCHEQADQGNATQQEHGEGGQAAQLPVSRIQRVRLFFYDAGLSKINTL